MNTQKADVYSIITDRIISMLEAGTVPWAKPWTAGGQFPKNLASGKEYRGVNVFLLSAMNYASPYWLTYKQAAELGGNVRKGEKSVPVVFWKRFEVEDKTADNGKKFIPMLRYYSVFNLAQCENIPADKLPTTTATENHSPVAAAESIVSGMPKAPKISGGHAQACYSPSADEVRMPDLNTFTTAEAYHATLFHELIHSTGHESRLARKSIVEGAGVHSFGSETYAKEELVAEMGAAFLCGQAGIGERVIENQAAYVAAWLKRLKEDNKLVVQAGAQAQRAADFILGKTWND